MSAKELPSVCKDHPKAQMRHTWDEDTFTCNGVRAGKPTIKNEKYECLECGRQLCSPEEYQRRERNGGHFA